MPSDINHLIIYSKKHKPLGELIFDHDLFCQALIYPDGDDFLGGWFEDWQINGILYYRAQVDSLSAKGLVGEYVNLHDTVFPSALRQWLEKRGLYSITMPDQAWDAWNYIQDLPLDDQEKFHVSQNIAYADSKQLESLPQGLENLMLAMEKSNKLNPAKGKSKTAAKVTKAKKQNKDTNSK